eukprot:TRINITY_DN44217_c0_g1_i1.p2 TRINITY_DN44217_c0_g1~~TRINITY_DN44217_c0_g1_i1.p2  ORF type:complete len:123 (-),score=48.89 TRINITY_DN44217_c0_g1_i1:23-391(-)
MCVVFVDIFFFFSSRRRHTRCREVSWARRCVQETGLQLNLQQPSGMVFFPASFLKVSAEFLSGFWIFSNVSRWPPMYSALIPVSYTHLTLPTILLVQISVVAVSLKKKKKDLLGLLSHYLIW